MEKPLVLLHGWSDSSTSLMDLARTCQERLGRAPTHLHVADYISLDDDVQFHDLVAALDLAWCDAGLPTAPQSTDIIVHSMGGLLLRAWLQWSRLWLREAKPPIDHCVMLAPANFGSPLAHMGRALVGRVLRGMESQKAFNVGAELLCGLELASPLTWSLAEQDCLSPTTPFQPDGIKCTVLVGDQGLDGLAALFNHPGTDGVVRWAGSNLCCDRWVLDFSVADGPRLTHVPCQSQVAFGILPGFNHRTILGHTHADTALPEALWAPVAKGLTVEANDFQAWCRTLAASNPVANHDSPAFQHTVLRTRDQWHQPIDDAFLAFSHADDDHHPLTACFHRDVIQDIHPYGRDPSYRAFLMDTSAYHRQGAGAWDQLAMGVTVSPEWVEGVNVGYLPMDKPHAAPWPLPQAMQSAWFRPHTVTLLDVVCHRVQSPDLLKLSTLKELT